jgi:iron complex transport system substrate-binding protein
MEDDPATYGTPTRRDYVKYGGTVIGGGLVAGCTGRSDSGSTPESTSTETSDTTETDASWTATMPPVGEVEFDAVPQSLFDSEGFVADVVTALGHGRRCSTRKFPALTRTPISTPH